ncbi:MAG: hypothetical protein Q8L20_01160 [Gammaproteobacteria bacterium]|nr:hypothetical protein [Gammaproteobacteria bacterium]MDP2346229.1 hypothetical protein [Gammaproteobacteria bacterium]
MMPAIKTLRNTAIACATLVSTALISTSALAQAATIPTSFLGTYNLTYSAAQPGSPITNGTQVQVVLAPGGVMCIAGFTLTNPVTKSGNTAEAHWTESTSGLTLSVSNIGTGNFNEVNVSSAAGAFLGQLSGSKASTSTTGCGASTPTAPSPAKIAELFEEAQKKFSEYFPSTGASATLTLDGYTYRTYPNNIYLAIDGSGDIYVMGGVFGNSPLKQGPLDAILSELAKIEVDVPAVPSGNSTLVITGTVGAMGFTTPISITIDNLPMPSGSDIDDVRKSVQDQYKDSGITGNITVTLISSSSTSTVFNIKFNGTMVTSGITITQVYDLTYTYTKK